MDTFDKFLNKFSSAGLQKRVKIVSSLGIFLCIVTVAIGYYFLTKPVTISIDGTGRWTDAGGGLLEASLGSDKIAIVPEGGDVTVELSSKSDGPFLTAAQISGIAPSTGVVGLVIANAPDTLRAEAQLKVRLVIIREPYWRLLWNK